MDKIEWRKIPYFSMYQVNNKGQVRSLQPKGKRDGILKPNKLGAVALYKQGGWGRCTRMVSKIFREAFPEFIPEEQQDCLCVSSDCKHVG